MNTLIKAATEDQKYGTLKEKDTNEKECEVHNWSISSEGVPKTEQKVATLINQMDKRDTKKQVHWEEY